MYAALDLVEAKWCILKGVHADMTDEVNRQECFSRARLHLSRIIQGRTWGERCTPFSLSLSSIPLLICLGLTLPSLH